MECNLALTAVKTDCYRKSFAYTGAKCWNALPDELKCDRSFGAFGKKQKFNVWLNKYSIYHSSLPFPTGTTRGGVGVGGLAGWTVLCWLGGGRI